jgi:hypothetical protein
MIPRQDSRSNENSPKKVKENSKPRPTPKRIADAFCVTGMTHCIRVCLNTASAYTSPIDTIKNAPFLHDMHINLLRGTASAGLQLIAKGWANERFGHDTFSGKLANIAAPVMAGVSVASTAEVYFIRKNTMRRSIFADPCKHTLKPSALKFNLPIVAFFAARETGFCFSVFNDAPLYQKIPILFVNAFITGMAHKLATIEITKDILQIEDKVPDYKIGFRAFRKIAYGEYNHPSFSVSIKNPRTAFHVLKNFAGAACGANPAAWRFLYLFSFSLCLPFAERQIDYLSQHQPFSLRPGSR